MLRVRNRIKMEIGTEQCRLVGGKETANAVYILGITMERSIEVQQNLCLCFMDYTKGLDTVKHQK